LKAASTGERPTPRMATSASWSAPAPAAAGRARPETAGASAVRSEREGTCPVADVNAVVGGYLRDLAFTQSSQQKMFGYKRAAAALLGLDAPFTELVGQNGVLPRIPGIGPGSTRVIREILETGKSLVVEHAIEQS